MSEVNIEYYGVAISEQNASIISRINREMFHRCYLAFHTVKFISPIFSFMAAHPLAKLVVLVAFHLPSKMMAEWKE